VKIVCSIEGGLAWPVLEGTMRRRCCKVLEAGCGCVRRCEHG
jgi:hypothetical protein